MESNRLMLALEPEAASLWCQIVTTNGDEILAGVGNKYMVVDLGDGTADITVHEKQPSRQLKELYKASGGPWGGIFVDDNYINWLTDIFGKTTIDRFKLEQMADLIDLHREFETKKRAIGSDPKKKTIYKISASMKAIFDGIEKQSLENRISDLGLSDKIEIKLNKLIVDNSIVQGWFDGPVDNIICHLKEILSMPKMKDVKVMILVGGFGENRYVQDRIKNEFECKHVIIPGEAGLAVLKGAVRFGHSPDIMSTRVMRYTYGIRTLVPYDKVLHPSSKLKIVSGEEKTKDIFDKFVTIGSEIPVGYEVTKRTIPSYRNRSTIPVFRTASKDPNFTTDQGCKEIGLLNINHHDEDESIVDKVLDVTFSFGDTELIVKAKIVGSPESETKVGLTMDSLKL